MVGLIFPRGLKEVVEAREAALIAAIPEPILMTEGEVPEGMAPQWYQPPAPESVPISTAVRRIIEVDVPPPTGIPEYVQTGLLDPVGLTDVTKEEMDAWPLTPEGLIDPRSPLYTLITAPGEKITELVKETTYVELGAMPGPGIALPGIGEIKIEMPDILGGLKDVGKYALIAGAVILAAVLFMRK